MLTPSFKSSSTLPKPLLPTWGTPPLNNWATEVTTEHFLVAPPRAAFLLRIPPPFTFFTSEEEVDDVDGDDTGNTDGISKLVRAFEPLRRLAAASYARAASSAVSKVPSQWRHRPIRSRISADHLPQGLFLTPLYLLLTETFSLLWLCTVLPVFSSFLGSLRLSTTLSLALLSFLPPKRMYCPTMAAIPSRFVSLLCAWHGTGGEWKLIGWFEAKIGSNGKQGMVGFVSATTRLSDWGAWWSISGLGKKVVGVACLNNPFMVTAVFIDAKSWHGLKAIFIPV